VLYLSQGELIFLEMAVATELEIAWAAGFFEGEGCFSLVHGGLREKLPALAGRGIAGRAQRDTLDGMYLTAV
jgi:hypothetical protein